MKTWTPLKLDGGRAHEPSMAWQPFYVRTNNELKVRINPGTANGFIPTNWKNEFTVSSEEVTFVRLKVLSSVSAITGITIEMVGEAEQASFNQTPTINFAPSPFYILLGVIYKGQYFMNYNKALTIYPIVWSTVEKESYSFGAEPYNKYFIWKVV